MMAQNLNLMPYPKEVKILQGKFIIKESFNVSVNNTSSKRTIKYVNGFIRRLSDKTGLFFNNVETKINDNDADFIINFNSIGKTIPGENESYELKIVDNKIRLNAETDLGVLRGIETLYQLLNVDTTYYIPNSYIKDEPRFKWRGLMIDACRHFMPVDVIKRNLKAMAMMKMNVFHWHLSEDQGVRVESKTYPKIQELASGGQYYTQEQIKEIVSFADELGIMVYPEFDIPGHSTAWFVAYPEFASIQKEYKIEDKWGIFDAAFDPSNEKVYEFFDNFFGEMVQLFPSPYFHIGGDEHKGKHWLENPKIKAFMDEKGFATPHDLQNYFNKRILEILTKYNKIMVGWDEIYHPDLPSNILVHSWRGKKTLYETAKKGYYSILSNGYYIDLNQHIEFHYLNDPIPVDADLSDDEKKFILGGEATMWSEMVTYENVDSRIWPRTAAIAERLWSPQNINDIDFLFNRIEKINILLEDAGTTHITYKEKLLRRMINNYNISPLVEFLTAVEPVKEYKRHFLGKKYTQNSPYTRMVDAAEPESRIATNFCKNIEKFILNPKDIELYKSINEQLNIFINNREKIKPLIDKNPILFEIDSLSINLTNVAINTIKLLTIIYKNKSLTEKEKAKYDNLLNSAKKSYAQMEIAILPAYENLLKNVKIIKK
jgi:hexosaminidase